MGVGDVWVLDTTGVKEVMAVPVTLDLLVMAVIATVLETFQVNAAVPLLPPPSVAVTTTAHVHGAVGVPVMAPVEELIARPVGRPVAVQV